MLPRWTERLLIFRYFPNTPQPPSHWSLLESPRLKLQILYKFFFLSLNEFFRLCNIFLIITLFVLASLRVYLLTFYLDSASVLSIYVSFFIHYRY